MPVISWESKDDDFMRECASRGLSFREIALEFGSKLGQSRTKNSCLGRARRIGIKPALTNSDGSRKRAELNKMRPKIPSLKPRVRLPPAFNTEAAKLRCVEVDPLCVSLSELEDGRCRYPYGDGPFAFCGHLSRPGKPYCGPHWALAMPADTSRGQTPAERTLRIRSFARNDRLKQQGAWHDISEQA